MHAKYEVCIFCGSKVMAKVKYGGFPTMTAHLFQPQYIHDIGLHSSSGLKSIFLLILMGNKSQLIDIFF